MKNKNDGDKRKLTTATELGVGYEMYPFLENFCPQDEVSEVIIYKFTHDLMHKGHEVEEEDSCDDPEDRTTRMYILDAEGTILGEVGAKEEKTFQLEIFFIKLFPTTTFTCFSETIAEALPRVQQAGKRARYIIRVVKGDDENDEDENEVKIMLSTVPADTTFERVAIEQERATREELRAALRELAQAQD